MNQFTDLEKTAIVKVLTELMEIDGEINLMEGIIFSVQQSLFDFNEKHIIAAQTLDPQTCISILTSMSPDNRGALVLAIDQIIKADGVIDPKEIKVAMLIIDKLNQP